MKRYHDHDNIQKENNLFRVLLNFKGLFHYHHGREHRITQAKVAENCTLSPFASGRERHSVKFCLLKPQSHHTSLPLMSIYVFQQDHSTKPIPRVAPYWWPSIQRYEPLETIPIHITKPKVFGWPETRE